MPEVYDALRPETLREFIGQEALKRELGVALQAAKQENRACHPILLIAPAGMGKTSLAACLANELELPLTMVMCPFDVYAVARIIRKPTLLFLDEIHRVRKAEQEAILPLIEDGVMRFGRREIKAERVSIVAASTEPQKLLNTLVDRFPIQPAYDGYTEAEMRLIVKGMFVKVGLQYSDEECLLLGRASAGVPRIAKSLVLTAADLMAVNEVKPKVKDVLKLKRIRPDGLSVEHCRYLWLLQAQEGTASLTLISSALGMPSGAIQQTERLLVQKGLLLVTPRGRALSQDGWDWVTDNLEEGSL